MIHLLRSTPDLWREEQVQCCSAESGRIPPSRWSRQRTNKHVHQKVATGNKGDIKLNNITNNILFFSYSLQQYNIFLSIICDM